MTRKDFEKIAKILAMTGGKRDEWTRGLVDYELRQTNANYSAGRFWARVEELEQALKLQGD